MDNLPNNVLSLILARVGSVAKLVHLRGVSTKWHSLIEKYCQEKQCLLLFDSFPENRASALPGIRHYVDFYLDFLNVEDFNAVRLNRENMLRLKERRSDKDRVLFRNFLARIFPNVEELVIGRQVFTDENVDFFYNYSGGWPSNLRSLTLVGERLRPGFSDELVNAINSKRGLRKLNLLFQFIKTRTNIRPLKETLSRLTHFGMKVHADIRPILGLLSGKVCTSLQMGRVSKSLNQWDDKIFFSEEKLRKTMPNPLARNLTKLVLTEFYDEEMLGYIYKNLDNLKHLTLRCIDFKEDVVSF